ncbi:unnamed protein product [Symbiodinium sp. CCMP2592]|nr:unnamed protein product [Symbiodinium sp. CCMP2592]
MQVLKSYAAIRPQCCSWFHFSNHTDRAAKFAVTRCVPQACQLLNQNLGHCWLQRATFVPTFVPIAGIMLYSLLCLLLVMWSDVHSVQSVHLCPSRCRRWKGRGAELNRDGDGHEEPVAACALEEEEPLVGPASEQDEEVQGFQEEEAKVKVFRRTVGAGAPEEAPADLPQHPASSSWQPMEGTCFVEEVTEASLEAYVASLLED